MKTSINRKMFFLIILCCVFITGCYPSMTLTQEPTEIQPNNPSASPQPSPVVLKDTPTPAPLLANIQTEKYSLDIKDAELLLRDVQEGITFRTVGIYAIDENIAFLFGSFQVFEAVRVRSVLFRTEDGGRYWKEVMPSFIYSDVRHVLFVNDGQGWATISLHREGLDGTTYWHTSDYGKSWEEIPNVNTGRRDVLGIKFIDGLHGQRILFDGTGNPFADGLVVQVTSDGGYSWNESCRVLTSEIKEPEKLISAYAYYDGGQYGSHWGTCEYDISNGCSAFGADGSKWSVLYDESSRSYLVISQSLTSDEVSIYGIPKDFQYKDGNWISP